MTGERSQYACPQGATSRRRLLAAVAAAPVLAGAGSAAAYARNAGEMGPPGRQGIEAVPTREADWAGAARALGRGGNMLRGTIYHTGFPRRDLKVISDGVLVQPALALGTHMAFVRYGDGSVMAMGDVAVTEDEMQRVIDAWQRHGIVLTALHKHLLAQQPAVWWAHVHGHGRDAEALARGLRAGLDRTGTPPPEPPGPSLPVDLDTAGIEAALGAPGSVEDGVFKCVFVRREKVSSGPLVLPSGLGTTCAFIFQPVGGGRAALAGDFAMTVDEVPEVLGVLRRGGIRLVELHNHHLDESPRLFFTHFWAVGEPVALARTLRRAVDVTDVEVPEGAVPAV